MIFQAWTKYITYCKWYFQIYYSEQNCRILEKNNNSSLFLWVQLNISVGQYWFRWWLGTNMWQAITQPKDDYVLQLIYSLEWVYVHDGDHQLQLTVISCSWIMLTVYPKKYAHGFCFAVLCCGYTLTDFPISIRLTSLALWQSNDCPSASKATLMNMDKYFMWIHYERLHNHNKGKHNKTMCIFLGIYCIHYILSIAITLNFTDMINDGLCEIGCKKGGCVL